MLKMRESTLEAVRLPSTTLTEVLVTGADPAGLVLAADLARHGVDTVVLDGPRPDHGSGPDPQPRRDSALIALGVPTQELLEDLGVLDRLIAATRQGALVAVMSAFEPLTVSRRVLLRVLRQRLTEFGGRVYQSHAYVGHEPDGVRLDCYLDGPAGPVTVRARYVVRAEGDSGIGTDGATASDDRIFTIAAGERDDDQRLQDAYNLGWKLAAVLRGAPEWVAQTYAIERLSERPSPLTLPCLPQRFRRDGDGGVLPGDRAPDAPVHGASGRPTRLATVLRGAHWTLLGYGIAPGVAGAGVPGEAAEYAGAAEPCPAARPGLHVHVVGGPGSFGDLVDIEGEVRWAYGLADGDWVLIRPDGLVAAVVEPAGFGRLREYLAAVGFLSPGSGHRARRG